MRLVPCGFTGSALGAVSRGGQPTGIHQHASCCRHCARSALGRACLQLSEHHALSG